MRKLSIVVSCLAALVLGAFAAHAFSEPPDAPAKNGRVAATDVDRRDQTAAEEFPIHRGHIRSVLKPAKRTEAGLTDEQKAMIKANCLWGLPKHLPNLD